MMNPGQHHFDDISDDDWSQNDGPSDHQGQVDSHQEYDEARRLLREMDDNYFSRDERRGFMTRFSDDEGNFYYDYEYPDYEDNQDPLPSSLSSSFRPPAHYVRPEDDSFRHSESPHNRETSGLPSDFENGQFSHGCPPTGSRRTRFADRSPPPGPSSRSHDSVYGDPRSMDYSSKGSSRLGRSSLVPSSPQPNIYILF